MSRDADLLHLLRDLSQKHFDREIDLTREIVPALAKHLGYAEAETFYEYAAGQWMADVVWSRAVGSVPWAVLEIKRGTTRNAADWAYQLKRYLVALNCRIGVVISPQLLILMAGDVVKRFDLRSISLDDVREIRGTLQRRSQQSSIPFAIRTSRLIELVEAVEQAATPEEKGKSLEVLANFLFDETSSLRVKYSNLQTRSSEIDLVVEYDRRTCEVALFEELGRYCLVECKNWSKPVGVGPVRDFIGKLDKCKCRLGMIFSKNGVTGVDAGADALREIQSKFDRDGVYLIVFSLEDLREVKDAADFLAAIDRKADALRFDAGG